jgi:hypothetical protein
MLAGRRERGEALVHVDRRRRVRSGHRDHRIERQTRRPGEGRAHHHDGAEDVGPRERAPRRDRRPEVVPDDAGHLAVAQHADERQHVAHAVQRRERREVVVEADVGAAAPAVAALVGSDDMEARIRERQHDLAPAVGELGKSVHEQDGRAARAIEAGLEHVHVHAVDARVDARANAGRQGAVAERRHVRRLGAGGAEST